MFLPVIYVQNLKIFWIEKSVHEKMYIRFIDLWSV